jgi:hypothetical protein
MEQHGDEDPQITDYRRLKDASAVGIVQYSVYRRWRAYGGPEEGGWYFDTYEVVRTFTVAKAMGERTRARLERYAERQNEGTRSYEDGKYFVCTGIPHQRESRPHYC